MEPIIILVVYQFLKTQSIVNKRNLILNRWCTQLLLSENILVEILIALLKTLNGITKIITQL